MRIGTWLAVGGVLIVSVLLVSTVGSWLRGRADGLKAADEDIARGTPCIRQFLGRRIHLTSDGHGIDRETGLPFQDTARMCGTGVDLVAEHAENAAYNAAIRSAFAAGKLGRFGLNHKVRTAREIQSLLAGSSPTELARDGDRLHIAKGNYEVTYHYLGCGDEEDLHVLDIKAPGRDTTEHQLFYPMDYTATRRLTPARGPFAAIVVDDQTTLLLRDAASYTWVIDLPRSVIIQVVAPIP